MLCKDQGSAQGCRTQHQNVKKRHLTTHELVRAVDAIRKGVTLLLQEDALPTCTSELVGQTNCCTERKEKSGTDSRGAFEPLEKTGRSEFHIMIR